MQFCGVYFQDVNNYNLPLSMQVNPDLCDWTKHVTNKLLVTAVTMKSWLLVFTRANAIQAQDFIQVLIRVAEPMGIQMNRPIM
jgi:hypothetical protein